MDPREIAKTLNTLRAEYKGWLDGVLAAAEADGNRGLAEAEQAKKADYKARIAELESQLAPEPVEPVLGAGPVRHRESWCGLPVDAFAEPEDAPVASMLPPLPGRTRAALASLYRDVGGDGARASANFRDTVTAVLGAMPLHPAVVAATQTEGVPADGGFAVMPDTARSLFVRAAEGSVFLRIGVRLEPMTSEERTIVALDDDDESEDAEATVKAKWKKEAAAATAQIAKLRQVVLHAHKLMVLAVTSSELSEDAGPNFLVELEAALARAMAKKLDRAVLTGTGAGAPLGLLNAPATISVSKTVNGDPGTASTFTWSHAAGMWARLAPGSHENAVWLIHPSVLPQALTMHAKIQNVAGSENVGGFQPAAVFQAGGPTGYQLLGRPVVVTSRCKALGTAGDVILVDPSQVVVGIRRVITLDRSIHVWFDSDKIAVRGTWRGDARPIWDAARTLVEGSDTVSPYVILEAR